MRLTGRKPLKGQTSFFLWMGGAPIEHYDYETGTPAKGESECATGPATRNQLADQTEKAPLDQAPGECGDCSGGSGC